MYRHSFQFYIAQDAHFLAAFFAAYQSAFRKAVEERDEDAEKVLQTLLQGVAKELELHASYAKVPDTLLWLSMSSISARPDLQLAWHQMQRARSGCWCAALHKLAW